MDQKTIKAASKAHALTQLGKEQFDNNKMAVQAIVEDFESGVHWHKVACKTAASPIDIDDLYLLLVSSNQAKNKLHQAVLDLAKPWNKMLIRNKPAEIHLQLVKLVDNLNQAHPRCTPLSVSHWDYVDFDPAFYLKFGMDDSILTLSMTRIAGSCVWLEGGAKC